MSKRMGHGVHLHFSHGAFLIYKGCDLFRISLTSNTGIFFPLGRLELVAATLLNVAA